jgi:hypothetical protein
MQVEENIRRGMSPKEARRDALLQFGGVEKVRLDCRDAWVVLDRFRLDLIHAFRSMRAHPGATAAVLGVLVLGIGLTTAMFALADPFLMRLLPYSEPDRLVVIECSSRAGRHAGSLDGMVPTIQDLQARTNLFESVAAYGEQERIRLRTPAGAIVLTVVSVTENFFDVLGVRGDSLMSWRATGADSERAVAVFIGPRTRALGSATGLLGSTFATENAGSVRVEAVLPSGFLFPNPRISRQPDAVSPGASGPIYARA